MCSSARPSHFANFIQIHVLVIAIGIENLNFEKIYRCSNVIGTSIFEVLREFLVHHNFLQYQILPCKIKYSDQILAVGKQQLTMFGTSTFIITLTSNS